MADEPKQPMYPRTQWVHAVRRWLDGEIGPDGEQLTLPGMPEPPAVRSLRVWFLVVADYANPEGFVVAPGESLQRRWRVTPTDARRGWRYMRQAGWCVPLGRAYPGHVQRRELKVPKWAAQNAPEPSRNGGSPHPQTPNEWGVTHDPPNAEWGVTTDPNGGSPTTPREVVRSNYKQEVAGASRPAPRPGARRATADGVAREPKPSKQPPAEPQPAPADLAPEPTPEPPPPWGGDDGTDSQPPPTPSANPSQHAARIRAIAAATSQLMAAPEPERERWQQTPDALADVDDSPDAHLAEQLDEDTRARAIARARTENPARHWLHVRCPNCHAAEGQPCKRPSRLPCAERRALAGTISA